MAQRVLWLLLAAVVPVEAQLTTTVSDFAVSAVTNAYVYRPRISPHPTDGSYAVTWGDNRNGANSAGRLAGIGDIYASTFTAAGTAVLPNFKIGDIKFGFFHDFSMYDSAPVFLANGTLAVGFHLDARTTLENIKFDDLYMSVYNAAGQAVLFNEQLNRAGGSASGYAYRPQGTRFGSDMLFVFRYYVNDLYHIGAAVVSGSTGRLDGDAVVVDNATTGDRSYPSVASNGARTVIVWADGRNETIGDIYLQAFAGTQTSGSNVKVNAGDAAGTYNRYPRAAMNASGQSVVVWIDTRAHARGDLYAQRYDASGAAVGGNFKLTNSASVIWEYPPAVGMDVSGNFVVAWTDSVAGGNWRVKTRAFSANGTAVTGILEVTNPATESLQIDLAMTPAGVVTYVWLDGRLDANNGRIFAKSMRLTVTSAESVESDVPSRTELLAAYPNPFNPSTQVRFALAGESDVTIGAYDLLGRNVARLVSGRMSAGTHTAAFDASGLPAGIYVVRLEAGEVVASRRVVLIK